MSTFDAQITQKIGNRIRVLRQAKGLTQENMADSLDMSLSGYSKIERGETDISISRLTSIANIFDLKANDLLETGNGIIFLQNEIQANAVEVKDQNNYFYNKEEFDTLKASVANLQKLVEVMVEKVETRK